MLINLEAQAGDSITECCEAAQRVANILLVTVQFNFNGVKCFCHPGGTAKGLENKWELAMDKRMSFASN